MYALMAYIEREREKKRAFTMTVSNTISRIRRRRRQRQQHCLIARFFFYMHYQSIRLRYNTFLSWLVDQMYGDRERKSERGREEETEKSDENVQTTQWHVYEKLH